MKKKNQNSLTRSRRLQRRRGTTDLAGSKQIDQVELREEGKSEVWAIQRNGNMKRGTCTN